jgi:hypothetical protein
MARRSSGPVDRVARRLPPQQAVARRRRSQARCLLRAAARRRSAGSRAGPAASVVDQAVLALTLRRSRPAAAAGDPRAAGQPDRSVLRLEHTAASDRTYDAELQTVDGRVVWAAVAGPPPPKRPAHYAAHARRHLAGRRLRGRDRDAQPRGARRYARLRSADAGAPIQPICDRRPSALAVLPPADSHPTVSPPCFPRAIDARGSSSR